MSIFVHRQKCLRVPNKSIIPEGIKKCKDVIVILQINFLKNYNSWSISKKITMKRFHEAVKNNTYVEMNTNSNMYKYFQWKVDTRHAFISVLEIHKCIFQSA